MRCDSCKEKIETTFLGKIVGTYIKDAKGKRHPICQSCQKGLSQDELINKF